MMRLFVCIAAWCLSVFACAVPAQQESTVGIPIDSVQVFVPTVGMNLLQDALRWSRRYQLETGGCFRIRSSVGYKVFLGDIEENVQWRRPMSTQLRCAPEYWDGTWHVHWAPASDSTVQCNMSFRPNEGYAQDLYTTSKKWQLNLVVCGAGRDSLIAYVFDQRALDDHIQWMLQNPDAAEAERKRTAQDTLYRCKNESYASLARGYIRCRP